MRYDHYRVEDFVTDEYFIRWVKSPDAQSSAFWNSWSSQHPDKKEVIHRAKEIVQMLDIREIAPEEGKFLEVWEKVIERTDAKEPDTLSIYPDEIEGRKKISWVYKIAAAIAVTALAYIGFSLYEFQNNILITTSFGESRTLFLPDSTKVTLNANSSLRYTENTFNKDDREVWLDGEAFFAVVHKPDNRNFKVHTSELEVEVLGTKFDVNSRRGKTKVILEEGRVKLDMNRSKVGLPLVMQPGDFVEVSIASKTINRRSVDPQEYLAWRNNRLHFSSTPLKEIADLIEDNYGYEVVFADPEIAERKFTGSTSSEDLQELTTKLSRLFGLKISQEGNTISIDTVE